MHTFAVSDYLVINYRPDLNMLIARWQRPVSGDETRVGYQKILEVAQRYQCPYWLLDGRRRHPADAETTNWGFQDFFPELHTWLGQPVYLSQLLSPIYQQLTLTMPVYQESESNPTQTYQMRRFNDEAQAVQWLSGCQEVAVSRLQVGS